MGLYKVTGPTPVGDYQPGDVYQADYTPADEHDLLANGRISLEPQEWFVCGNSKINKDGAETLPGGTFTAAYTAGELAALDGAIAPAAKTAKKKTAKDAPADQ